MSDHAFDERHAGGGQSAVVGGVHQMLIHDSAERHVSGEAVYVDDIPEPRDLLHLYIFKSQRAHARFRLSNLEAAAAAPGVARVLTSEDVDGKNDFGHVNIGDDPVLAEGVVLFPGQPVFAVAADTIEEARRAAQLVEIEYEDLPPVITIEDALQAKSFLCPPHVLKQGDAASALRTAPHHLQNTFRCGAQEHFYLEGQVAMAVPKEEGDVHIYSATQDPSAVQHLVARVIGRPANAVMVEVRRMGGAFGGKETFATLFAAIAAIAAIKTGRPAKCRLDRDDDMIITGKRHETRFDYDVGFDDDGRVLGLDLSLAMRCGYSHDQSIPILDRAISHCDNAYFLSDVTITGYACKTNTASNCAFRGFGSPQAMLGIERVMDDIAFHLGKEPYEVRMANMYGVTERNVTPYDWKINCNILPRILEELEEAASYAKRRQAVKAFNAESEWLKKGIALFPMKYGVGFTASFLNQAGALIHVYQDGSVYLNHGGTEMGQGLYQKVAQIVAEELQIDVAHVKISSTVTDKVPNTTATAASSGTDMNGAAAQIAARKIRSRLTEFAAAKHNIEPDRIRFEAGMVQIGNEQVRFEDLVLDAYMNLVSLSATGFYTNPDIKVDPGTMKGRPYHYYVYGGAVVESLIDTLTGESRITRIDIVHDVGKSINPALDMGQLEGGFIQGMGWLTTEEVVWDDKTGELRTHAPSTYKIPVCSDRPKEFNMHLVDWSENAEDVVYRSKAIGEPPLNLAVSVFNSITDAVASVADYKICPKLNAPATPEAILRAVEDLKGVSLP